MRELGARRQKFPHHRRGRMSTEHDSLVRVEVNFEEFPFFQPRKVSRMGSYAYERTTEGENGARLDQKWTVISSSESALPGSFDMDVFIAVLEVLERRGGMPASGTLEFSLYELAEVLGVKLGGRTYEDLKESLERIAMTSVRSENAFWVKGQKRHITDTFRLWDITFDESQNKKGEKRSRHRIEFGRIFMRSFHDHYLRGLDTDLYRALASPVAKRLYRIIDHARDGSGTWETDLKELQRQIPIGPYKYPAKIREKLGKPHEELVATGFLSRASYPDRERVLYEVAEDFMRTREDLALAGTNEEKIAIKLLTESGLRGDVARDLVAKHGPSQCTRYANALPHQKNLRNPAGWLRRAIEEGYEIEEVPEQPTLTDPPDARQPEAGKRKREIEELQKPSEDSSGKMAPVDVDVDEEPEDTASSSPPVPDPKAQEAWRKLAEDLASLRGEDSLPPWWSDFQGGELVDRALTILVPNGTAANHLNENFGEDLVRLWRERAGADATLLVATSLSSDVRGTISGSA